MSKQTFVANTILTAAQMNTLQTNDYNQTVSTKTASYTLVASDAGTTVVMNAAGATTITVNTSLFTAGDTLKFSNIGAGVCTVTAGTATVSSAGPLAIPQYGGGTLYFTSAGVSVYSPTAVTIPAAASALTYITSATLSSSSTTITNCFSATYENYLILCNSISGGTNGSSIHARFGISGTPTTANYLYASGDGTYSSQAQYPVGQFGNGPAGSFIVTVLAPQLATQTFFSYQANSTYNGIGNSIIQTGYQNSSSQFTDFVVIAAGGTFSGGTVRVYGYSNS